MTESNTSKHEGLLCPVCRVDLVMSDRQGIEIDYCPKCRGVWLDRGELDKIIERSMRCNSPAIRATRSRVGTAMTRTPAAMALGTAAGMAEITGGEGSSAGSSTDRG